MTIQGILTEPPIVSSDVVDVSRTSTARSRRAQLPIDRAAIDAGSSHDHYAFELTEPTARRLQQVTNGSPLLRQVALVAAIDVCLLRYGAADEQVVAVPKRARVHDRARLVPVVAHVTDEMRFRDALMAVRQAVVDGPADDDRIARDGAGAADDAVEIAVVVSDGESIDRSAADLTIAFEVEPSAIRGNAYYARRLYSRARITRLCRHAMAILEAGLRDPAQLVRDIDIISDRERADLQGTFAIGVSLDAPAELVHQQFEERARRDPGRAAFVTPAGALSYGDLARRASRLADRLIRRGIGPEDRVALLLDRTMELPVAIIAVLQAGAAYVPLDPAWPRERLAYMLEHSRAKAILTSRDRRESVAAHDADVIDVTDTADADDAPAARRPVVDAESLAYLVYTSGSTGLSKAVGVSHGALATRIAGMVQRFGVRGSDRLLQCLSPSADAFGEEIYPALVTGARVVMDPGLAQMSPTDAAALIEREQISILHFPAAFWAVLASALDALGVRMAPSVRLTIIGGEAAPPALVSRWLARTAPGSSLVNAYGPTETTITATSFSVAAGADLLDRVDRLPLGTPLASTRIYLLDDRFAPVPVGVPGEIFIGGSALARGYFRDSAATAARFVPDPFGANGSRLYRSGDRAQWLETGLLDFLGRADEQLKVRGYRIEPGEIEAAMERHPAVRQSAVVLRPTGESGEAQLIAYLVARGTLAESGQPSSSAQSSTDDRSVEPAGWTADAGDALTSASLVRHLRARLPDAMIPATFCMLEAFPLTPSGKVDRRALHGCVPLAPPEGRGPRDSIETQIQQIWRDVLGVSTIGIQVDFFEAGGHSLRAITLAARLEQAFGSGMPVRTIFDHRTIEAQAAFVRQQTGIKPPGCLVPLQSRGTRRPLFCVHPGGGLVQVYADLAAALHPEQPVYGLQAHGFGPGEEPLRRVEDMAARYIADVRTVQPRGPYQLTGLCYGCAVVLEMARQLRADGESVACLVLLDGGPVTTPASYTDEEWQHEMTAWREQYLVRRAAVELGIPEAVMNALSPEARLARYLASAQRAGIVPSDVTLEQFERFLRVFGANILALTQYRPQPYDGPVTLLRTARDGADDTLGWRPFLPALTARDVPGTHLTFFRRPLVGHLATALESLMDPRPGQPDIV